MLSQLLTLLYGSRLLHKGYESDLKHLDVAAGALKQC